MSPHPMRLGVSLTLCGTERMIKRMRRLRLPIAVAGATVAAAACVAVGSAAEHGGRGLPYAPPSYMERYLLTAVKGGVYLHLAGVNYGPVEAALCRGNGDYVGQAQGRVYRQFVCAVRLRNADRLALILASTGGTFTFKQWL